MNNHVRAYLSANGRLGGKSTSAAKQAAARENGRKGGRPTKKRRKTGQTNKGGQRFRPRSWNE